VKSGIASTAKRSGAQAGHGGWQSIQAFSH